MATVPKGLHYHTTPQGITVKETIARTKEAEAV